MNQTLLKFKIMGIPVNINLSYLFLCFIWSSRSAGPVVNAALITVITLAILGHELGHAMVLRHLGIQPEIHLVFWGGETVWKQSISFHRSWGLLLNAAGVVVNIILAAIAFCVNKSGVQFSNLFLATFFEWLFIVNAFLAVLNLLPVLPLDGGKIFHTLSGYFLDAKTSVTLTVGVSCFASVLAAVVSFKYLEGSLFIPLIFGFFAFDNFKKLRMLMSVK